MRKKDITTCQANNSLVSASSSNIYYKETEFTLYLNKNIDLITDISFTKNTSKSIPITNAKWPMHPLLIPNYNYILTSTNIYPQIIEETNTQHPTNNVLRPAFSQNVSNRSILLPVNDSNNHHINLTTINTLQPLYQQVYVLSDPSQIRNLSHSSVPSYSTYTPVSITKSYSVPDEEDTTKRMISPQNITPISYPPYDHGTKRILQNATATFKNIPLSSMNPALFNKQLSHPKKRQRLGPSCDTCRSRKVKCDATIEVLYEDDRIINEISNKLVYLLKPPEVKELSKTILRYYALPEELFVRHEKEDSNRDGDNGNSTKKHYRLLKHINKIVLFQPCSSCIRLRNRRRKNSCADKWKVDHCSFSRGLTKSDASIFDEIHRVTGKNLDEMTIEDFRITSLQT